MRPTANAPARTADEDAALWDAASLLLDPPALMMNPLVTDPPGTTAATGKTPRSPVTAGMDGHQSSTGPSSGDESAASTPTSAAMAAAPPASASSTASHTTPTPLASAWLNWDNPRATVDIAANLPDGALALRRFKNRESMRRARQRQRDQLQHLRDVVAALEAQYSRLSVAASQRLENEPDGSSSTANDTSSNGSSSNSDYTAAVGLAKRLGAENLLLRSTIQDQADWKLELHRVFETMGYLNEPVQFAAAPVAPLPFQLDLLNPFEAESVFGFHPITESDVKDLILENSRVVARVKNQLLADDHSTVLAVEDGGASPPPVVDVSGASRMDVFGWDVRERVEGPEMHFVFSKRFEALAVPEVMQRTWVSELQLTGMQKVKYDTIRLAPLQEVSANAYVLGRDVRSPDENPLFRSTLLRFRIETSCELPRSDPDLPPLRASGFVIGTQTLNPHANAGAALVPDVACASAGPQGDTKARLVWADLMYAIEFLTVEDPAGESGGFVLVRWAGKTNYGSEFDAYRNTADKLSSLLHWELQNVSPPVQLLSGSLGDERRTN